MAVLMLVHLPDNVFVAKSITESVIPLKTKDRKTLILRILLFKEVVPPVYIESRVNKRKSRIYIENIRKYPELIENVLKEFQK